jgi:hypothetical protein
MQLGKLLSAEPGVPCVTREVRVQLIHLIEGEEHRAEVPALLAPVTEPQYEESRRFAIEWLTKLDPKSPYLINEDGKGLPIPDEVLEREQERTLLLYALRDPERPVQPLVPQKEYQLLRKGLVRRQVKWLHDQYFDYMDKEYPETIPPKVAANLAAEIEKKS